MKRSGVIILLMILSLTENLQISPKSASEIITATQRHFQAKCLVLVTFSETLGEQLSTFQVQREINSLDTTYTSAAMKFQSLSAAHKNRSERCSQRIFAFHPQNTDLHQLLMKISAVLHQFPSTLWLILSSSPAPLAELFLGVYIPYDVQMFIVQAQPGGVVVLTEAFRVGRNESLQVQEFGRWTPSTGLEARNRCLQIRRPNLKGVTLRLAEYNNAPMSITRDNPRGLTSSFQTEIWSILEKSLNFSTSYVTEEGTWGNQLPDGSWDGMIAKLLNGVVDVASVTPMFSERADVAAFTFPLYDSDYNVYMRKRFGKTVDWSEWLAPFSPLLWTSFAVLTLATGVLMVVLSDLVRRYGHAEVPMTMYDQVFLVYGAIICQQGQEGTPFSWPCRIIYFISYFTGIVVISSYSATVVSRLTVVSVRLPFTDLEGLLRDGGFGLGALVSSFSFTLFKNAEHGLLKQLYDRVMTKDPANFIEDNYDGFYRACTKKFGFISTPEKLALFQDSLREIDCLVVALPKKFLPFSASFMLPKNSPYIGLFNHEILRLLNDGVLRKTYKKFMEAPRDGLASVPFAEIQIEDVTPMLGIVVGGIISGIIFLGIEILAIYLIKKYKISLPQRENVPVQRRDPDWMRHRRFSMYGSAARMRQKELYPHYLGIQRRRHHRSRLNA